MADFIIGDYGYTRYGTSAVRAKVVDSTKTLYADIPSSVTYGGKVYSVVSVERCFEDCTSLTTAPTIPSSVTSMVGCFEGCTSLVTAPVIPSSVVAMEACFIDCTSLTGDVYICCTGSIAALTFEESFYYTTQPITIYTTSQEIANDIISSYGSNMHNVTFGGLIGSIIPTPLNSRPLTISENTTYGTTTGYLVDMLLSPVDRSVGIITGVTSPTMKLYTIDDIEITYPYALKGSVRCYGVASYVSQVPSSNVTITIQNTLGGDQSTSIGLPSTATFAQIKQEGETDLISPTIDVTNVRFNPETTGLNKYTVGDVIGVTLTDMTKSQTNVDGNVKHIVTHADNVKVNDTTTLQDWITEQYNNLT